ncbi:substrate-binding domain-containing protein [Alteribacter keqinensis]|uniref:LacI family DNA-binding transcriptional regulator n=1 Tax=Alteribacter keqinensis TaxID=2483800 RepID=A0A3M7TRA1_9BACI|nr:substrate-binding domain-containing protein [Alteribacter keqinensis]RNA67709.1 LacI family DNA-binding transcriptional regulator [Alteribacter keqinensis]
MADVARQAGVSKSTVSQYLNKRFDYMGAKTKARIESAISELGYQPNIVARSLKQKSTQTIGVIVANILHSFSTQVIRAIEDYCHEHDFHLIVCNADDNPEKEKKYIEMLLAKQVDGLIVFPTGGNLDLYKKMKEGEFPLVFMDRIIDEVEVPTVQLNNERASDLAVTHLAGKGYSNIGMLTTSLKQKPSPRVERINGFKQSHKDNGLSLKEGWIKSVDVEDMQGALREMFNGPSKPDAILASNDLSLIEVLKFVKESGLSMPEDLAVIGIDRVSFADLYSPTLTYIAQPTFEMGRKAASIIIDKVKNNNTGDEMVYRYEPELIPGESC